MIVAGIALAGVGPSRWMTLNRLTQPEDALRTPGHRSCGEGDTPSAKANHRSGGPTGSPSHGRRSTAVATSTAWNRCGVEVSSQLFRPMLTESCRR